MDKKRKILIELGIIALVVVIIVLSVILLHEHRYEKEIIRTETCTEEGQAKFTCWCGNSYEEYPKALGHEYVEEVTKEATCTEEGMKTYKCSRCDDAYENIIVAKGHEIITENKEPECEIPGYDKQTCRNCDFIEETEIAALEHDFQLSEEKEYEKIFTCQNCGETKKERKISSKQTYIVRPDHIDPSLDPFYDKLNEMIASGEIIYGSIPESPKPPEGVDINNLPDNQRWTGNKLITVDFDSMMSRPCEQWTDDENKWALGNMHRTDLPVIQKKIEYNKIKYAGITLH